VGGAGGNVGAPTRVWVETWEHGNVGTREQVGIVYYELLPPLPGHTLKLVFPTGFQNMRSDMKLIAKEATGAEIQTNSTSPRSESNGRRPGARFGPKSGNKVQSSCCLPEQSWVLSNIWGQHGHLGIMGPLRFPHLCGTSLDAKVHTLLHGTSSWPSKANFVFCK